MEEQVPMEEELGRIPSRSATSSDSPSLHQRHPPLFSSADNSRLIGLLFALSLSLVAFVVVPIVVDFPYFQYPWLNVADVWKMLDPVVTVPLFYLIFDMSPMLRQPESHFGKRRTCCNGIFVVSERRLLKVVFMMAVGVYVEGHGIHTAATIFKDPLKDLMVTHPEVAQQYPRIPEVYAYIRDDWQHLYSHYIYVTGALAMSVVHMLSFRTQIHAQLRGARQWAGWIGSFVLYGLLFAGTSINFPAGLYVGFAWIAVYGGGWLWWILSHPLPHPVVDPVGFQQVHFRSRWGWRSMKESLGRRLVLQFYLLSYAVGLLVMLIWVAIFGFRDRASANVGLTIA